MEIARGTAILKGRRAGRDGPAKVMLSFAGQNPATRGWRYTNHSNRGIDIEDIQPETLDWLMRMRPKGVEFLDFRDGSAIGDTEKRVHGGAFENSNLNQLLRTIRMVSLEWEWQPAWVAIIRPPLYATNSLEYTRRNEGRYSANFMDMVASYMCNRGATVSAKATSQNFCQHECRMRGKAYWHNEPNTWGDSTINKAQPFALTWPQRKAREASRTTNIILIDPPMTDFLPFTMAKALELDGFICESRHNTTPYGHSQEEWNHNARVRQQQWDSTREFIRFGRSEIKEGVFTNNKGLLYTSNYSPPVMGDNKRCPQRKTEPCESCREIISTCDDSECQDCYQMNTVEKNGHQLSTIGVGKYGDEAASSRRTSASNPFDGPSYIKGSSEARREKHALQRCLTFLTLATQWHKGTARGKRKITDNDASHHKWAERSGKGDMTILNLRETIQAEDLITFARAMSMPSQTGATYGWMKQLNNWEDALRCWKSRSSHIVPFYVRHSNAVVDKAFREMVIIFHRPDGHQCRWFINYDCRSWTWTNAPRTWTRPKEDMVGSINNDINVATRKEWDEMDKFINDHGKE